VEGLKFDDDLVPAVNQRAYDGGSYFDTTKHVWLPGSDSRKHLQGRHMEAKTATVSWTVGGSFDIDSTEVVYGPWDELPSNLANAKDGYYPSPETSQLIASDFLTVSPSNIDVNSELQGRSMWHKQGAYPKKDDNTPFPTFEASLDLSKYPAGTKIAVFAKAKVDKSWTASSSNVGPAGIGSVSHIVNARTNPAYFASNAGKIIQGRENSWWFSAPISLVIGSAEEETKIISDATASNVPMAMIDGKIKAIYINSRTGGMGSGMDAGNMHMDMGDMSMNTKTERVMPKEADANMASAPSSSSMPWLLVVLVSMSMFVVGCVIIRRKRRMFARRIRMERIRDEEDDFNVDISEHGEYRDDGVENSGFGSHEEFTID
jgi:hypothetical protein